MISKNKKEVKHMLCLKVIDKEGKTVSVTRGELETNLVLDREYKEGDCICLEVEKGNHYIWLQIDDALGKSLVYVTGNISYWIPFGEKRINLSPKAFSGKKHLISARMAQPFEVTNYRNLAFNVNDQHGETNCYPHASANVETRGEAVFAAKNAIDGVTVNSCHGEWPYASWGINRNPEAVMKLEFGRKVRIDRIVLYTRADFPHDSWWVNGKIVFSDQSVLELPMKKSELPHIYTFEAKDVEWLELGELKKADDPSPFPALTQIEVYGYDLESSAE